MVFDDLTTLLYNARQTVASMTMLPEFEMFAKKIYQNTIRLKPVTKTGFRIILKLSVT